MHKRQKQFNPSGIKWPTKVDMLLNKTQTDLEKAYDILKDLKNLGQQGRIPIFMKHFLED